MGARAGGIGEKDNTGFSGGRQAEPADAGLADQLDQGGVGSLVAPPAQAAIVAVSDLAMTLAAVRVAHIEHQGPVVEFDDLAFVHPAGSGVRPPSFHVAP